MRSSRTRILFVLSLAAIAAVGACSLNPQPIPPGDEPDGGKSDFGGGTGADAGLNSPTPGDSGPNQDLDASDDDASDASDASSEDAGDAEADADAT